MSLGLSWKFCRKKKHSARDSIDRARPKVTNTSTAIRFQLYINTCFDHGLRTLQIRVVNTLDPKSLEPNQKKEKNSRRTMNDSLK